MKVRDLKVGDVVTSRADLKHGKVGEVTRIEERFGNSPVRDVYFEGARSPNRIHFMTEVETEGESLSGKGFSK